jgi:hypothetical protein
MAASPASTAFKTKLQESALTDADAKKLGFSLKQSEAEAAKLQGLALAKAGFVIPYFDLSGKPTKFWRYRYLESTKSGFDALTDKKERRYTQPPKTVNELYLPPLIPWNKVAKETKVPIIITEGELKAACAAKHGFACIGLGGVWCFKSISASAPLLPMFEKFEWEDREVVICYDSDAVSNPMVMQAENALARELTNLGARPKVARIPPSSSGKKMGLDDYIVAEGKGAFRIILGDAQDWRSAKELFTLNGEVVYAEDPGIVLRLDTLQRMAPHAFIEHAFSTRIYHEEVITEKGSKHVEKSAAREWIKWPGRASVRRITYAPGQPRFTSDRELNIWSGWGCEPKKGDVRMWTKLLDFLVDPQKEPEGRRWLEQWLAWPLIHPGTKLYTAVVLWGLIHGTGKSTVGYTMFRIYGSNATEIADKDLLTSHNEWAENKQFVLGDEITGGDKRGSADRMKSMITQKQLRLNPKYIPSYTVPDCINYLFTSNHPDSFFLEDTDRRFAIFEVCGAPMSDDFYQAYLRWLDHEGGREALFHHLLTLDVSDFKPHGHAPQTKAKKEMIDSGRSDVATWVATLKESPDTILKMGDAVINRSLWTTGELHALYDPEKRSKVTANGMGRELKRAAVRKAYDGMPVPVPAPHGPQRLWILRDVARLAKMKSADLVKVFLDERSSTSGPVVTKEVKYKAKPKKRKRKPAAKK